MRDGEDTTPGNSSVSAVTQITLAFNSLAYQTLNNLQTCSQLLCYTETDNAVHFAVPSHTSPMLTQDSEPESTQYQSYTVTDARLSSMSKNFL